MKENRECIREKLQYTAVCIDILVNSIKKKKEELTIHLYIRGAIISF
jgi:hypothetical protein